jgi:hypothetical protein
LPSLEHEYLPPAICERCLFCEIKWIQNYQKSYFGYKPSSGKALVYICHSKKRTKNKNVVIMITQYKSECEFFSNTTLNHPELFE